MQKLIFLFGGCKILYYKIVSSNVFVLDSEQMENIVKKTHHQRNMFGIIWQHRAAAAPVPLLTCYPFQNFPQRSDYSLCVRYYLVIQVKYSVSLEPLCGPNRVELSYITATNRHNIKTERNASNGPTGAIFRNQVRTNQFRVNSFFSIIVIGLFSWLLSKFHYSPLNGWLCASMLRVCVFGLKVYSLSLDLNLIKISWNCFQGACGLLLSVVECFVSNVGT